MSPRLFHLRVSVDVGEKAQAESLRAGGVREAVDGQRRLGRVEGLADPLIHLVVGYRAPEGRLAVRDGLQIYNDMRS